MEGDDKEFGDGIIPFTQCLGCKVEM